MTNSTDNYNTIADCVVINNPHALSSMQIRISETRTTTSSGCYITDNSGDRREYHAGEDNLIGGTTADTATLFRVTRSGEKGIMFERAPHCHRGQ